MTSSSGPRPTAAPASMVAWSASTFEQDRPDRRLPAGLDLPGRRPRPGLGFSTAETGGLGGGAVDLPAPGGGVLNSSMALDGANPVIAYSNFGDPYTVFFYRYKGAGPLTTRHQLGGPAFVTNGYEPSLAGGPGRALHGLPGLQRRHDTPMRSTCGATRDELRPREALAVDPSTNLFAGGAIAQSPSGNRLAVAWPGTRSGDDADVMRLFTSTDGGASFSESHIAHIADAYGLNNNADLATTDGGSGWLLFTDASGLQPRRPQPDRRASRPRGPAADLQRQNQAVTKKAGPFLITLRLPKSCVQSRQKFFIGVGKRKRKQLAKKLGGGKLRFTKVVFIYDGKKLKVKKKKPFRYLVDPGDAAGSVHRVKAKVTAILTKKTVARRRSSGRSRARSKPAESPRLGDREEAPLVGRPLEPVGAARFELDSRADDELPHGARDEHLAGVPPSAHPGADVDRHPPTSAPISSTSPVWTPGADRDADLPAARRGSRRRSGSPGPARRRWRGSRRPSSSPRGRGGRRARGARSCRGARAGRASAGPRAARRVSVEPTMSVKRIVASARSASRAAAAADEELLDLVEQRRPGRRPQARWSSPGARPGGRRGSAPPCSGPGGRGTIRSPARCRTRVGAADRRQGARGRRSPGRAPSARWRRRGLVPWRSSRAHQCSNSRLPRSLGAQSSTATGAAPLAPDRSSTPQIAPRGSPPGSPGASVSRANVP